MMWWLTLSPSMAYGRSKGGLRPASVSRAHASSPNLCVGTRSACSRPLTHQRTVPALALLTAELPDMRACAAEMKRSPPVPPSHASAQTAAHAQCSMRVAQIGSAP